jgi:cardiolipin synthase (CMP-forming)
MRHLPNLLTLARIMLTPFIAWHLSKNDPRGAFPILFFAGFSDGLDGYLARRFGWTSRAGAFLDPIADKLLLVTLWIGLGLAQRAPWWMVGLALGRDLAILAFSGIMLLVKGPRDFPPSIWGKRSTFFQLSYCGWQVIDMAWHFLPEWWLQCWLALAAVATFWSAVDYYGTAGRMLRRKGD